MLLVALCKPRATALARAVGTMRRGSRNIVQLSVLLGPDTVERRSARSSLPRSLQYCTVQLGDPSSAYLYDPVRSSLRAACRGSGDRRRVHQALKAQRTKLLRRVLNSQGQALQYALARIYIYVTVYGPNLRRLEATTQLVAHSARSPALLAQRGQAARRCVHEQAASRASGNATPGSGKG